MVIKLTLGGLALLFCSLNVLLPVYGLMPVVNHYRITTVELKIFLDKMTDETFSN